MRTIITTIVLTITMLYTGVAQDSSYTDYNNWFAGDQLNRSQSVFVAANSVTILEGSKIKYDGELTEPLIGMYVKKADNEGAYIPRMFIGYSGYAFDTSEEDRNYVVVETIVDGDRNSIESGTGHVYNDKGFMTIKGAKLFARLKDGKNVYVKLSAGNKTKLVIKVDARGFLAGYKHAVKVLNKNANPFNSAKDDNPFKG